MGTRRKEAVKAEPEQRVAPQPGTVERQLRAAHERHGDLRRELQVASIMVHHFDNRRLALRKQIQQALADVQGLEVGGAYRTGAVCCCCWPGLLGRCCAAFRRRAALTPMRPPAPARPASPPPLPALPQEEYDRQLCGGGRGRSAEPASRGRHGRKR